MNEAMKRFLALLMLLTGIVVIFWQCPSLAFRIIVGGILILINLVNIIEEKR